MSTTKRHTSRKGVDSDALIQMTVNTIMRKLKWRKKHVKMKDASAVIISSKLDINNDLMIVSANTPANTDELVGTYDDPERWMVEEDVKAFYGVK